MDTYILHQISVAPRWQRLGQDENIVHPDIVLRGGTHTHTGRRCRSILGKSSDLNTYIRGLNQTLEMWGFILFIHIQKKTLIFETLI